jgi:hypothetical protein
MIAAESSGARRARSGYPSQLADWKDAKLRMLPPQAHHRAHASQLGQEAAHRCHSAGNRTPSDCCGRSPFSWLRSHHNLPSGNGRSQAGPSGVAATLRLTTLGAEGSRAVKQGAKDPNSSDTGPCDRRPGQPVKLRWSLCPISPVSHDRSPRVPMSPGIGCEITIVIGQHPLR